ncbi:hypothetical protein FKM82_025361, partial [Ascaphus truei]
APTDGWNDAFQTVPSTRYPPTPRGPQPEGTKPASDYNWDSAVGGGRQDDFFTERVPQSNDDNRSPDGDWGGEENWESVDADQGLSKAEVARKKREERHREMEAKRAERRAAKGPLKLGATNPRKTVTFSMMENQVRGFRIFMLYTFF